MNEEFINSFFIDTKLEKLNYLKEFVFDAYSFKCLKCFIQLHSEFIENIKSNYPMLNRFGVYFQPGINTTFRREYLSTYYDYAKVKIKNYFYLHFREKKEVCSYIVKLNKISRVYASHIHHKYDDGLLSLNFLIFMSLDSLSIENIEPTEDILPTEEINSLNNTIRFRNYGMYRGNRGFNSTFDHVQIDVPWENVISIDLNRYRNLILDTWLDACVNTKQLNNDCKVNLSLSCTDIQK